jgi:hypothetical protein
MSKSIEQAIRTINGKAWCFASMDYTTGVGSQYRAKLIGADGIKVINPLWKRKKDIVKTVKNIELHLGIRYQDNINARLERDGKEGTFTAKPAWYIAHSEPHTNLVQNKDRSQTYVKYEPKAHGKTDIDYTLDGIDVTDQVKAFMVKREDSKAQADAGLTGDQQIKPNVIKVQNITRLKVNGMEITQD